MIYPEIGHFWHKNIVHVSIKTVTYLFNVAQMFLKDYIYSLMLIPLLDRNKSITLGTFPGTLPSVKWRPTDRHFPTNVLYHVLNKL